MAVTPVVFENAAGDLIPYHAKIDTGFTESIGLPREYIEALALEPIGTDTVRLADNQEHNVDVYTASVVWGSNRYIVRVHQLGTMPLIGMSMLRGFVLTMDTRPGGAVSIEAATGPIS